MTWLQNHRQSEDAAVKAHQARRRGETEESKRLFSIAARHESEALSFIDVLEKPRTFGITAVSCVALSYKAGEAETAERLAHQFLSANGLPPFAIDQLRGLLQIIWNEQTQLAAGVSFVPGQITVSVDGGEIVRGGAPLDLVVDKVQTIQNLFFRTVEWLKSMPLRRQGPANKQVQEYCRPWLFQSVPGSYQFSVAIQGPQQADLFHGMPSSEEVAEKFMELLQTATRDPDAGLLNLVPEQEYRSTFLKLARNLAPSGRSFTSLEIKSSQTESPVVMTQESRKQMTESIRASKPVKTEQKYVEAELRGTLRALHLEKDWLEVAVGEELIRVEGVGETVDDLIGPLVNHEVIVHVAKDSAGRCHFRDLERYDAKDHAVDSN